MKYPMKFTPGTQFQLKLDGDRLHFSNSYSVPVEQIILGIYRGVPIEEFSEKYSWIVVKVANLREGILALDVVHREVNDRYQLLDTHFETHNIEKVKLETPGDFRILTSLTKEKSQKPKSKASNTNLRPAKPTLQVKEPEIVEDVSGREISQNFTVPLKDVWFEDGYAVVTSNRYIDVVGRHVQLTYRIKNDFIRKEYEDLKHYISDYLKIRDVKITATVFVDHKVAIVESVTSEDILKINDDLFVSIPPISLVRDAIDKLDTTEIRTLDDLVDTKLRQRINVDEQAIFESLLEEYNTIHSPHLQYLSEIRERDSLKLRFFKKPLSFMFLVQGNGKYHFVWEAVNDQLATYIWSFDGSEGDVNREILKTSLVTVEANIKEVLEESRNTYRFNKHENFSTINHQYSKEGFTKWKSSLNRIIYDKV